MKLLHCLQFGIAVAGLSACGDPNSLGGAAGSISGSGGTASGGTSGTSGSGGTAGGSGGGIGADSGGSLDEVTLRMDPFVVESGKEVFLCQTFANPFGSSDVYLREFESHMTPGSHHLIVNRTTDDPSGLTPCSGLQPPSGPFSTQSSDDTFTYQEGVAALFPRGHNFALISHYFNSGRVPLSAEVMVTLRRARPETVRKVAWIETMSYIDIDVPPHQSLTVQGGVTLAEDQPDLTKDVLLIQPHMHSRGTNFKVTAGPGATDVIYETDRWEAPSRRLDPPYRLNPGDSLNYACTFFNDGEVPLTFGESAATNEMCLLVYHYTSSSNEP